MGNAGRKLMRKVRPGASGSAPKRATTRRARSNRSRGGDGSSRGSGDPDRGLPPDILTEEEIEDILVSGEDRGSTFEKLMYYLLLFAPHSCVRGALLY